MTVCEVIRISAFQNCTDPHHVVGTEPAGQKESSGFMCYQLPLVLKFTPCFFTLLVAPRAGCRFESWLELLEPRRFDVALKPQYFDNHDI
jgi:hypothetical protein